MENDVSPKEDQSLKYGLFILFLLFGHFAAATSLAKLVGVSSSLGLFLVGAVWVWFGMSKVNAWLVINTPFGKVWDWAHS